MAKVPDGMKASATLPGKLTTTMVDRDSNGNKIESYALVEQEGYGIWPVCQICLRTKPPIESQIEPTEWNNHSESHIS